MENKQFTEIEKIIKALEVEFNPLFKEIQSLVVAIKELEMTDNQNTPLLDLISRLTKTARRHNVDKKVKIANSLHVVGTNHQGLGYEHEYSSQLNAVRPERLWGSIASHEQRARDILFDDEAVIDIASIIKKSNQKIFLKVIKILKKYNLFKAFENYKDEHINTMDINLENDYQIKIYLDRYYRISFALRHEDNELFHLEIETDDKGKPIFNNIQEEHEILKPISKTTSRLDIHDIKKAFYIVQHSESMIKAIKSKRTLLNSVKKDYKNEHTQLKELLNPLLALEKL